LKIEPGHESRTLSRRIFPISWKDAGGITQNADARLLDASDSRLDFSCDLEVPVDTVVHIAAHEAFTASYSVVSHCTWNGDSYIISVELQRHPPKPALPAWSESQNYYEFLQISPAAQAGTIHRVFRYLAGLYHPDNPETGDSERFLMLNRAYQVLSDPERRAAYDAELNRARDAPSPAFAGVDFMDGVEGELNRRLAVLAVLYRKCRSNINEAQVTLVALEAEMGFPREYLDFTTWYLKSKKYISKEDNSDFSLTATGVDFVEENYAKIPLLRKLLGTGTVRDLRKQSGSKTSDASPSSKAPLILPIRSEPVR
jgi:curved DNA-binding protein